MDNRLTPEKVDALLEDALKNQPLAPMPRSITSNVMARIRKDSRPRLVTWSDFALSLVLALSIGAVFFALQNLPPVLVAKLRIQGILFYHDLLVNGRTLIPAILFGLSALLSAWTLPSLRREYMKS